jgi:uncharacterized phage protein gp47/JayE
MAVYFKKSQDEILRSALAKIKKDTLINATNPGSVARAITEAITTEIGAYYDILDFNLAQSLVSSATGSSLDKIGSLYNVNRKTVGRVAIAEQKVGSFYFYIDTPHEVPIIIPSAERVFTANTGYVGAQLTFTTNEQVNIPPGSIRAFANLTPEFADGIFSAPAETLTAHNFISPTNVSVKCLNPKTITASEGYERDEDYRARITRAIRVASSGTIEAIRFAGLNVPGVRDIRIRQAPYGLGSFELLIVSEQASMLNSVAAQVKRVVDVVRPVGVTMFLKAPTLRPLDVAMSVSSTAIENPEYPNLGEMARISIIRYINTLMPGDPIVYNKLIQAVMDCSAIIKDVQIVRFAPNGVDSIRRNYTPKEHEQIVPGRIDVSVS